MENFGYDPLKHPIMVKQVLDRMQALIDSGKRSAGDPVGALVAAMSDFARDTGREYDEVKKVIFAAM